MLSRWSCAGSAFYVGETYRCCHYELAREAGNRLERHLTSTKPLVGEAHSAASAFIALGVGERQ